MIDFYLRCYSLFAPLCSISSVTWRSEAKDLVCWFSRARPTDRGQSLSQASLEACSSSPCLVEDNLQAFTRIRWNLLAIEELEGSTEECCFRILQMLLSTVRLPLTVSLLFKSLMIYCQHYRTFCLADSEESQFNWL